MARLSRMVPEGGTPQGLSRVYLACHPADLTKYRKQICDDIWEYRRCAIYYYEDASQLAVDGDYYSNLDQMQLIVVPVTSRFLNEKNLARDVDFPYAIQQKIPVLPLMQQPGLEEQFNRVCGQLQFLNPKDSDSTAIRYQEKLRKYLDAVLLDDIQMSRIHSAFDATIFLSYRKKDRRYAQKLMKLIHRNDFCRGVAIWYDEFLVPGENFNSNIRTAIETCDLFALVVTPNLVNEKNYVMTTEYPLARQLRKPVMAAEMVDTNADQLASNYDKLPVCIDPENENALSCALAKCFEGLVCKKRTPQQDYLLGQAYLQGIRVETDRQLGMQLITAAAEKGCEEAMETLATMYTVGKSVTVNEPKAMMWQDRLMQRAKERYQRSGTLEDGIQVANRHLQTANQWKSVRRNDQAKAHCHHAVQLLARLYKQYGSDELLKQLAACAGEITDVCEDLYEQEEAESWAIQAVEIAQKYARKNKTVGAYQLLYFYCWRLGTLRKDANAYKQAAEAFHQSLEIWRLLEPHVPTYVQTERISVYENLGQCVRRENHEEALGWFRKATELAESICEAGDKYTLQQKYINIAKASRVCGRFQDVMSWMRKAEACIPTESSSEVFAAERYEHCEALAEAYEDLGFAKEEIVYRYRALEIARKQANETSDNWYMMKAESCCRTLAKKTGDNRFLEEARAWQYRQTQNLQNSAKMQEFGPRERELIQQYQINSMRCRDEDRYPEAVAWIQKAVDELEQWPPEGLVIDFLLDCYEQYGNTCGEAGDIPAKRFWYEKACKLHEERASSRMSTYALESMYHGMARLCEEEMDFAQACIWHEKRMRLLREKNRTSENPMHWRDIARCWSDIADCQVEEGLFVQARQSYGNALRIWDQQKKEDKTCICSNELESIHEGLGRISAKESKIDEAIGWYWKVLLSRAERVKSEGTRLWLASRDSYFPQQALKMADNMKETGDLYARKGDTEKTRFFYEQSIALLEGAVEHYRHPQERKKLSEVRQCLQNL